MPSRQSYKRKNSSAVSSVLSETELAELNALAGPGQEEGVLAHQIEMLAIKYSLTPQQIGALVGTERGRQFQNQIAPSSGEGLNAEQYGSLQQQAAERGMSPEAYINHLQLLADCETVTMPDPENPGQTIEVPTNNTYLTPEQQQWLSVLRSNNLIGEPKRTEAQKLEHTRWMRQEQAYQEERERLEYYLNMPEDDFDQEAFNSVLQNMDPNVRGRYAQEVGP